jgi:hypothetical protein
MKSVMILCILMLCQDKIENPEYKAWAGCKPGTFTTVKQAFETAGIKSVIESTVTLVEIDKDKAVLETKSKATAPPGGAGNPRTDKQTIPAKVAKDDLGKDSSKAKVKEGDEEIEVGGKKVKCHWVETTAELRGSNLRHKIWHSPEVPGSMVKMEQEEGPEGGKVSTRIWVVAFEKK